MNSLLERYKAIKINSYYEWIEIQKYLYLLGFSWYSFQPPELLYLEDYDDTLIVLNREKMILTWCYSYDYVRLTKVEFNGIKKYEIINASVVLRKEKLKKIEDESR